jgi:hypothetical protein
MTDRYRVAGLYMRALCACMGMICLAWVLTTFARKPNAGPQVVTVTVARPADVAPTLKQLLPPLEVAR